MFDHIFFVSPEVTAPTGGVNVIFQFAEILQCEGLSVSVHFETFDYCYGHHPRTIETTFSTPGSVSPKRALRARLKPKLPQALFARSRNRRHHANAERQPTPRDLVVLPEVYARREAERFNGLPTAILCQGVYLSLMGAFVPMSTGAMRIPDFRGFITTSRACRDAVDTLTGATNHFVPLSLSDADMEYRENKKRQICFMPRRRREEVLAMVALLEPHAARHGFALVPIDDLPIDGARGIMAESLIFLSFSQKDGFGMPPAEAMALGCIVIGYTGVGGNEYFTTERAVPVAEDDFVAFFRAVLRVLDEYAQAPGPYDRMRRSASEHILGTYRRERTTEALVGAVSDMARLH